MNNRVSKPTVGVLCGSTVGELHGLPVAQQVKGGGDQDGLAEAMMGSDNCDCRRGRIDGLVGIACCNVMDAEHSPGQRIGVLSGGGADERITVKYPSTKMVAGSDIGVGTLLVENCNPSLVGAQKPDAGEATEVVVPTDPRRKGRS
jgi:hypothetical protein